MLRNGKTRHRPHSATPRDDLGPDNRLVGYARVSTAEQNLDMQIDDLKRAGVRPDNLWVEHVSGVAARRPMLAMAIKDCRPGDVFIVWRLDRLARNAEELHRRVRELGESGITFRSLKDSFDTKTAVGKLAFGVFALFAEFERNVIAERTAAGMRSAKDRGVLVGRDRAFTDGGQQVVRLLKHKSVSEVARELKVSRTTVYNYKRDHDFALSSKQKRK